MLDKNNFNYNTFARHFTYLRTTEENGQMLSNLENQFLSNQDYTGMKKLQMEKRTPAWPYLHLKKASSPIGTPLFAFMQEKLQKSLENGEDMKEMSMSNVYDETPYDEELKDLQNSPKTSLYVQWRKGGKRYGNGLKNNPFAMLERSTREQKNNQYPLFAFYKQYDNGIENNPYPMPGRYKRYGQGLENNPYPMLGVYKRYGKGVGNNPYPMLGVYKRPGQGVGNNPYPMLGVYKRAQKNKPSPMVGFYKRVQKNNPMIGVY